MEHTQHAWKGEDLNGTNHLEAPDVDGRIILKRILGKQAATMSTGFKSYDHGFETDANTFFLLYERQSNSKLLLK